MADTRFRLTACARRLTAERGVNGFTVEEVCELVDVSRRTFFNYFHSKEEAIVGHTDDVLDDVAVASFVDARPAGSAPISATLLDDLAALVIAHVEAVAPDPEQARSLTAAIAKEPHLLGSFMRSGLESERLVTELVARREGLAPNDPVAAMAASLFFAVARRSSDTFFTLGNTVPFPDLIHTNLAAARAIFAAEHGNTPS